MENTSKSYKNIFVCLRIIKENKQLFFLIITDFVFLYFIYSFSKLHSGNYTSSPPLRQSFLQKGYREQHRTATAFTF